MAAERLTDQDITKLVSRMLDVSSKHPHYPFTRLFTIAQEILPAHKRYRKSVIQQRSKWSKKLQQAIKDAGMWPGYQPPVDVATPPPAPVATPAPTPAPAPVVVADPPQQVPLPTLVSQVLDRLVADLWQRVSPEIDAQVRARLKDVFERAESAAHEKFAEDEIVHFIEHEAMPVSIRRVFVIGLLPEQIVILRKKVIDLTLELRFWKNEAQTKLTENAEWSDEIIVMSKFVSHSDIHAVRNKVRNKVKYCNGAVSELERMIRFPYQEAA